jgi:predicted nucleic acid-binding protein
MMASNSVSYFIDANVPMYAAGAEHPLKEPCRVILDLVARRKLHAVTDATVIQEILHRYTALGQRERGVQVSRLFLRVVPVVLPLRREDIETAIGVHASNPRLQAHDSVHAAVMMAYQITCIISADKHFDGLPGIERKDPSVWGLD